MSQNQTILECFCALSKRHRLIFDGGCTGKYIVELCNNCYEHETDKRFLISYEIIEEETRDTSVE